MPAPQRANLGRLLRRRRDGTGQRPQAGLRPALDLGDPDRRHLAPGARTTSTPRPDLGMAYYDFLRGLSPDLTAALRQHVRTLLDAKGCTHEPLEWEPLL